MQLGIPDSRDTSNGDSVFGSAHFGIRNANGPAAFARPRQHRRRHKPDVAEDALALNELVRLRRGAEHVTFWHKGEVNFPVIFHLPA